MIGIVVAAVVVTLSLGLVAVAYRPLLAQYHYSIGYTCIQRKDYDKAIAEYNNAIRLDPKLLTPTSLADTPGTRKPNWTKRLPTIRDHPAPAQERERLRRTGARLTA